MMGIMEMTAKVDGLIECDACGRYFAEFGSDRESNVITSGMLPKSNFCSTECRDEAEQAAEDARRSG
jgi:hypothetical protein